MVLLEGREFTGADARDTPPVAIVNDTFARAYFDNENALGRRFNFTGDKTKNQIEIIGIVKTGKYADLREKNQGFVLCPYGQRYKNGAVTFYVRSNQKPDSLTAALRQVVGKQDANLPIFDLKAMEQQIDKSVFADRVVSGLSAVLGLLATAFASVGL
jgi:putative ABC transport system permease protein